MHNLNYIWRPGSSFRHICTNRLKLLNHVLHSSVYHTLVCCDVSTYATNRAADCNADGTGNCDLICKTNWIHNNGTKKCHRYYIRFSPYVKL